MILPPRRRFLLGAGALIAAPSIVRASSLMPVSVVNLTAPADTNVYGVDHVAFSIQYRQEFIAGFERQISLLRRIITTENELPGPSPWLVADAPK